MKEMKRTGRGRGMVLAAWMGLTTAMPGPVMAQMSPEEEQRCVWQCLYNSPGAASRQYNDCVARMCTAPSAAAPAPAPVPPAAWKGGAGRGGEHYAGVEIAGAALTFVCRPDGTGTLGVGGVGGNGAVTFEVDRQGYGLDFSVRNGVLLADVPPRSHLVRALMNGSAVRVGDPVSGRQVAFPLTGSGTAIRSALAGCGVDP